MKEERRRGREAEKLSEADPLIPPRACRKKPAQTRILHSPSNTHTHTHASLGRRTTRRGEGTFGRRGARYERVCSVCSWPCLRIRFREHACLHTKTHTRPGRVWREVIIIPSAAGHPLGNGRVVVRPRCRALLQSDWVSATAASLKAAGPFFILNYSPPLDPDGTFLHAHTVGVGRIRAIICICNA